MIRRRQPQQEEEKEHAQEAPPTQHPPPDRPTRHSRTQVATTTTVRGLPWNPPPRRRTEQHRRVAASGTRMFQFLVGCLAVTVSSSWSSGAVGVAAQTRPTTTSRRTPDYTCFIERDYADDNTCRTIADGVCDDPNWAGTGGSACAQQDCMDCNIHCKAFVADCVGCLNAPGCYYCPEDGTCENSDMYSSTNSNRQCTSRGDYYSTAYGDTAADKCTNIPNAYYNDPLWEGSAWVYDSIQVRDVWEQYQLEGTGITIRINDDGVYTDHIEFDGRFAALDQSCQAYAPLADDIEGHGTAVAGILVGNANNAACSAGIASQAKFSSCNFFAPNVPYSSLAYKLHTFDISQNSIGMPACGGEGLVGTYENTNARKFEECPFLYQDDTNKRFQSPCEVCTDPVTDQFMPQISTACADSITDHCKQYYKHDKDACRDFPEFVIGTQCDYNKLPKSAVQALELGILTGREGKGTIFVFASGNDFAMGDDVNYSGWTNSRYTITVGAIGKQGKHADYSTPGSALVVTGPGGGSEDVGHLMTAGLGRNKCADSGQGTSFACPVVSGVIALMLEARPELTWRDVQGILAKTSKRVIHDQDDISKVVNGGGFWHSRWYGFGVINALAAVEAAMEWELWTEEEQVIGISKLEMALISDDADNLYLSAIDITNEDSPEDFITESTVVLLDLEHNHRGDLELILTSPDGTKSLLHPGKVPESSDLNDDERWKLMTVRNWGENPIGSWSLSVRDLVNRDGDARLLNTDGDALDTSAGGKSNVFRQWKLITYGRSATLATADNTNDNDSDSNGGKLNNEAVEAVDNKFCMDQKNGIPTIINDCDITSDGNQACPAGTTLTFGTEKVTIDANILCPIDVTFEMSYVEASQKGLCGCDITLFDGDCKPISDNELECQCFICPTGSAIGASYSCNTNIAADCSSFDCDGNCNGPYKPPLFDGEFTTTNSPASNPTTTPGVDGKGQQSQLPPSGQPIGQPVMQSVTPPTGGGQPIVQPVMQPVTSPTGGAIGNDAGVLEESQGEGGEATSQIPPSGQPIDQPIGQPVMQPFGSNEPPVQSSAPTRNPTIAPTADPTNSPTYNPTASPTAQPKTTDSPTKKPTEPPTKTPTTSPTNLPTPEPTKENVIIINPEPTESPTKEIKTQLPPSGQPIGQPVMQPVTPPIGGALGNDVVAFDSNEEQQVDEQKQDPDATISNFECDQAFSLDADAIIDASITKFSPVVEGINDTGNDDFCLTGLETNGGWYEIDGNGKIITITACSVDSSKSLGVHVFTGRGSLCTDLTCVENQEQQKPNCGDSNDNGFAISFVAETGTFYHVLVSGLPFGVGSSRVANNIGSTSRRRLEPTEVTYDYELKVTEEDVPTNTECLLSSPAQFQSNIQGNTVGDEAVATLYDTCDSTEKTGVWYTVSEGTPKLDGSGVLVYQANACQDATSFNTEISVFRGDDCDSLQCVKVETMPCQISGSFGQMSYWTTSEREIFHVFVHGGDNDSTDVKTYDAGKFQMDISYADRKVNDQCTGAIEIDLNEDVTGTTSGAKPDVKSIDASSCAYGGSGAWYSIIGNGSTFQASTCMDQTDHQTTMYVYSGRCAGLNCVDHEGGNSALCGLENDAGKSATVNFITQEGVTYYILVTGRRGTTGDFGLKITEIETSSNNECGNGEALALDSKVGGSTLQATVDFPSNEVCGVALDSGGVWYAVDGTGNGLEVSVCGDSNYNAAVSVFKGSSCTELECVTGTAATAGPQCDFRSVTAAWLSESNTQYYVYVHGHPTEPNNMGSFDIVSKGFQVLTTNEFCPQANLVPVNGERVQGSTEDATHAAIATSTCGPEIVNPGLWYTFKGTGQPYTISACAQDEDDFDVSVSVFTGSCDDLTCISGSTFVDNACSSSPQRRYLQAQSGNDFRFMTTFDTDYYVFVHGQYGEGDFDLYINENIVSGYGTEAPTPAAGKFGKDLYRWIPVNNEIAIVTDYSSLTILSKSSAGSTATTKGSAIMYASPLDYVGIDIMTVDGCRGEDCYRFDVTIRMMGDNTVYDNDGNPADFDGDEGWNKLWLLMLLLIIPLCILPILLYFCWYRKRNEYGEDISEDSDERDAWFDDNGVEDGKRKARGTRSDSSEDDWDSEDDSDDDSDSNEDDEDESHDDDSSDDDNDDGESEESSEPDDDYEDDSSAIDEEFNTEYSSSRLNGSNNK